ncbi:hypothetical protein [Bradyrhizobium sp. SSUT77]|uniref:hypothetical protein n=1 Tax=Bradyrhizobium sp. SSUT77 TaxID=3040603 RepID=UPI002448DA5D|nr:hypothetical protein [Bradyrhizobium sp. SSUT77]MDH2347777.1 hypothetical protein [Bradyrhizobium sp. SSUT77]
MSAFLETRRKADAQSGSDIRFSAQEPVATEAEIVQDSPHIDHVNGNTGGNSIENVDVGSGAIDGADDIVVSVHQSTDYFRRNRIANCMMNRDHSRQIYPGDGFGEVYFELLRVAPSANGE